MLVGFQVIARPKRARDYDDERDYDQQAPMRPERRGEQRRAPSTDQKRIRHQQQRKVADAHADATALMDRLFAEEPSLARVTWYAQTPYGQQLAWQDIEVSRRTAAVSYATTIDDVLRSTDV